MLCGTGCVGWGDGCCEGHMKDCEFSCHEDLFVCNSVNKCSGTASVIHVGSSRFYQIQTYLA